MMAAMTIQVSCTDLEPVKAFFAICKGLETDERISQDVRTEYANAFRDALEDNNSEGK